MAQVEHNRWFMIQIDGKEYRAKWKDYGYEYATARVDWLETKSYRKYLLFGPKIVKKKWKNAISSTIDAAPEIAAVRKQKRYDATWARMYLERIFVWLGKDQKHSQRI